MTRRRMYWLWPTLAVLLSVASVAIAIVALYVDDWRRDLTSNSASTSDDPRAPLASPHSDLPPAELANHVISVAGNLPRWRLVKLEEGSGVVTIRFIRATPLFRFKDDITIRVTPEGTGSILHAESKSRLGTADFGQNPRNLRELLDALDDKPVAAAR